MWAIPRPSTSKYETTVWTAAVVFAILAIHRIRFSSGHHDVLPNVAEP